MFSKQVDMRSRKAMVEFLNSHFRYDTMSSWNRMTSYANNVKLWNLGLSSEQLDKAFEIIQAEYWEEISGPIDLFEERHHHEFTIRTNGRSGGYLVLYNCYLKTLDYRSFCTKCGQRNFKAVQETAPAEIAPEMWSILKDLHAGWTAEVYLRKPEIQALDIDDVEKVRMIRAFQESHGNTTTDNKCGRCGSHSRVNFERRPQSLEISPKGIDSERDFEDWDMDQLKARVRLVQDFDRTCEDVRQNFLEMLDEYEVEEETYMVPQTRKVLRPSL
jgi:hypothetical protein